MSRSRRAIAAASAFVAERLNGEDGLGGIFPAMVNAALMFDALGLREQLVTARRAIDRLLVEHGAEAYCQPCLSPVWDTALMCHALLEEGSAPSAAAVGRALAWLRPLQVLDRPGDWRMRRPRLRPGGWAFQYANPHYPDVDDTAVVAMAMDRAAAPGQAVDAAAIARADEWVRGMQCRCGGWGAFEADNTQSYLNSIPFADHGALLDPPTADVSARCLSMLAWALLGLMAGGAAGHDAASRGVRWLLDHQGSDGLWDEPYHTATGFERVFYLRYHGYARYFPLWALARYRNLRQQGKDRVAFGM